MKFNFTVSKLANNFFFISNLSEWHFSCRRDYNEEWLRNYPLSSQEKKALLSFKKLIKKYCFNTNNKKEKYLGNIFYHYRDNQVWIKLKKTLSKSEYKIILNTFEIFSPRFEQMWKNLGAEERERRVALINCELRLSKNNNIIRTLDLLFDQSAPKNIRVITLFSPLDSKSTAAGSANIGPRSLTLEIPKLKKKSFELNVSTGILFHEIIHIISRTAGIEKIIKESIKKLRMPTRIQNCYLSTFELVNETLVNSLAPYGYLLKNFYGKSFYQKIFSSTNVRIMEKSYKDFENRNAVNPYRLIKYLIWKDYDLINNYLEKNKLVDKNFVKIIISILNLKSRTKEKAHPLK